MVQLQVACYKKKVEGCITTARQLDSENQDDCDIISELLFHNDGANDIPKHQISQNSTIRSDHEKSKPSGLDDEDVIRTNVVMFEFRDHISNLNDEDIGPFASFFENDCDFLEQVAFLFVITTSYIFPKYRYM